MMIEIELGYVAVLSLVKEHICMGRTDFDLFYSELDGERPKGIFIRSRGGGDTIKVKTFV